MHKKQLEIKSSVAKIIVMFLTFLSFGLFLYQLHYNFHDNGIFWDVGWYKSIAIEKYTFNGDYTIQQNMAFMPFSPLFDYLTSKIFNINYDYAMYLNNFFLMLLSSFVFFKFVNLDFDRNISLLSVTFLLFNPFSIYFYNGYSESKFLFLFILYLFFLRNKKWLFSSLAGGISFLIRPYGILLIIPFLISYLFYYFKGNNKIKPFDLLFDGLLYIIIFLLPFCFFTFFSYANYGDPFLQYNLVKKAWGGFIDNTFSTSIFNLNIYFLAFDLKKIVLLDTNNVSSLFYVISIISILYLINLNSFYFLMIIPFIIILCIFQITTLNLGRYLSVLSLFTYIIYSVIYFQIIYKAPNKYIKICFTLILFFVLYLLININLHYTKEFFSNRWVS